MPFDSSGNATITRNRAVTGQTVQAAQVNTPFDDVQSMLSQVLLRSGVAPMTGPLNMNGFKGIGAADGVLSSDLATVGQIQAILSDPWAVQPIGTFIAAGPWGFTPPPKNRSYRYVLLTAGQSGAGGYNEGILTTETVSGARPIVLATAVVSLTGSPLNGLTIRLINTEERFLRGAYDAVGTIQDSENLSHAHGVNDPTHAHPGVQNSPAGHGRGDQSPRVPQTSYGNSGFASTGITIQNSGGSESRPRNISVNYYLRIL